jgi:hypothetical protein
MVILDRIRLTGLLRKKPWKRGFFYSGPSGRSAVLRGLIQLPGSLFVQLGRTFEP